MTEKEIPREEYLGQNEEKDRDFLKLNLGCGKDLIEGWVNVDIDGNPDVKHDLNSFPYPFSENTFTYVKMSHILEHLNNPLMVMLEVWRICKDGANVYISVPWHKMETVKKNPEHRWDFAPEWFRTLCDKSTQDKNYSPRKETFLLSKIRKISYPVRVIHWIPGFTYKKPTELTVQLIVKKEVRKQPPCGAWI